MADKDIREDFEIRGEVLPDGPRSEGRAVTREPDPTEGRAAAGPLPASDEPAPVNVTDGAADAAEPHGAEDAQPQAPIQSEAVVGGPQDLVPSPAEPATAWHDAIAEALAESEAAPSRPADAADGDAAASVQTSEPASVLARDAQYEPAAQPVSTLEAPGALDGSAFDQADTSEAAAKTVPEADPAAAASFTDAAADLFRPQGSQHDEDPHLITIGRRLNPALRIPKPVAPEISARPQPSYEPDQLPAKTWWPDTWPERLRAIGRYALYAIGGYLAFVLVLILLFRFVNPPGSMYMLTQLLTGTSIDKTWVPISSISPHLVRAVVVSEDGRFCEHSGIDTAAIKEAIDRSSGGTPRGASTISMQVIKNLFLWNAKSYVRKVVELPLTLIMELLWPKQRILEIYLNIAEWGPGVFGAEAAARHHFNKPASRLSEREAALLASVLPNPVVRDASSPSAHTSAKARVVQSRVRAYGAVASCVVSAAAAAPAASPTVPGVRQKAQQRPAQRKKQPAAAKDDWSPTLNFGPN